MSATASILVVAATARELAAGPWRRVICGVGPVEAAIATAREISKDKPAAILHVGIAGARRSSGLAAGAIVIGTEARYCDLGVSAEWAPSSLLASPDLLMAAQRVLPLATTQPVGTSARVGGTISDAQAGTIPGAQAGMIPGIQTVTIPGIQAGMIPGIQIEAMEGFAVLRAAALAGIPAIEIRAISNEIEETDRARWNFDMAFDAIIAATPLLVAEFERILNVANKDGHA